MSSFFLPLINRPILYSSIPVLGLSLPLALHHPSSPFRLSQSPSKSLIHCQFNQPHSSAGQNWSFPSESLRKQGWGQISPETAKQVSLGSVLGLGLGITLKIFSKALVLAVGLGVIVVQFAASRGYNIIPVRRLQKYVKSVDLQRVLTENVAFKSSFGVTMALAAVAEF